MKKTETQKEYVLRNVDIDTVGWCWIWTAHKRSNGYGVANVRGADGKFKIVGAHRVSYEAFKGTLTDGLHIDHLCRNPSCVNPDHLELVVPRENVLRGKSSDRLKKCKRGHEFTPENTYMFTKPDGSEGRACATCRLDRTNESRRRAGPERIAKFKEHSKKAHAKYYSKNADVAKARTKKWAEENPERKKAAAAEWYQKNRERILAKQKAARS